MVYVFERVQERERRERREGLAEDVVMAVVMSMYGV